MTTLFAIPQRAIFSPCGLYRYRLWREWGDPLYRVLFLMLNPSTADSETLDPTVRRCIDYAKQWGFGALDVGNMFAWRSTDPSVLSTLADPIGPDNDAHIFAMARAAARIVIACGNHGELHDRYDDVLRLLREARTVAPVCLGITDVGLPVHPLYQPKTAAVLPVPGWLAA